MEFLRHILRLFVVMLVSALGASVAFAVPMNASEISFYQADNTLLREATDVSFAARAPPLAVANVATTGDVTVMQGSAFALHGQETVAALFGFGVDLNAPNRTDGWAGIDTGSRGIGANVSDDVAGWVRGPDGSSIAIHKTANGQPDWQRFIGDNAEVTSVSGAVDASSVRFTQNSIGSNFSDGGSVNDLVTGLRNGSVDPNSLPPIRTFEVNGQLFSLDNRRLYAYQQAGIDIPTTPATSSQISRESFKFTTPNGGQDIAVRGQ
jgi:hypothetical protein